MLIKSMANLKRCSSASWIYRYFWQGKIVVRYYLNNTVSSLDLMVSFDFYLQSSFYPSTRVSLNNFQYFFNTNQIYISHMGMF